MFFKIRKYSFFKSSEENCEELFEKIKDLSPYELSGGEKRKIAIITFLLLEPKVFILDEPTVALDPVSRTELLEILKKLQLEAGMTIIQSTHMMEEAAKYE